MNKPLVTFIIANHNYECYLGDAIKSALKQTYPNINVCVIDDSSDSVENVEKVIKTNLFSQGFLSEDIVDNKRIWKDEKHIAIFLKNGPYQQAYARNAGIYETINETDFFAILDADDICETHKIERLIQPMLSSQHIGVTYADYETLNVENGRKCREFKEPFDFFRLRQECIVHSGALIRKTALMAIKENNQFFDNTLSPIEDYDCWMRLAEKFMFVHIPEALTLVRVHPQNSTNTTTHDYRMSKLKRMYEKITERNHG